MNSFKYYLLSFLFSNCIFFFHLKAQSSNWFLTLSSTAFYVQSQKFTSTYESGPVVNIGIKDVGNATVYSKINNVETAIGYRKKNTELSLSLLSSKFKQTEISNGTGGSTNYNRYTDVNGIRSYEYNKFSIYLNKIFESNTFDLIIGMFAQHSLKSKIIDYAGIGFTYKDASKAELVYTLIDSIKLPNSTNNTFGLNIASRLKLFKFIYLNSGLYCMLNRENISGYNTSITRQYFGSLLTYNNKEYVDRTMYALDYKPYISLQFLFK